MSVDRHAVCAIEEKSDLEVGSRLVFDQCIQRSDHELRAVILLCLFLGERCGFVLIDRLSELLLCSLFGIPCRVVVRTGRARRRPSEVYFVIRLTFQFLARLSDVNGRRSRYFVRNVGSDSDCVLMEVRILCFLEQYSK